MAKQTAPTGIHRPARRRTRRSLVGMVLAPGLLAAGVAGWSSEAGAAAPKPVVTTTNVPGLGTVLVSKGRLVFAYTNGRISCTGACASFWQPLIVTKAQAKSLGRLRGLSIVRLSKGRFQVTFRGYPLFFFVSDTTLTATTGDGLGNVWYAVHPDGTKAVLLASGSAQTTTSTAPPAPTTSTPATSPPTGGGSTNSGGNSGGSGNSSNSGGGTPATSPPATSPPATSPPATSPPATSPPATSPPPTSPPPTSPPPTSPPPTSPPTTTPSPTTTAPGGGGVSF